MNKSHQIRLYPTKSQEILFRKSCGVARFSYNWALAKWKELYEAGESTSAYTLIKLQNSIKKTEFPWMLEVTKNAPQYAIHNLERGFRRFFKKAAKYPKFKKKGGKDSFRAVENYQQFKQSDFKIHIPRIGKVKCAENLRFNGKVNNVVIKRAEDEWFAVVNIEVPNEIPVHNENQVITGVDLGIKTMVTTSNGQLFENPKVLQKNLKKLKRCQKSFSRKQKDSNNRRKQKMKLARLHYRISCIRSNAIHEATTSLVRNSDVIVLEDLKVSNMLKNRKLARALGDVSLYEIRRQIEYKAAWAGKTVILADTYFPSSKTCSCCGWKKRDLKLSDRTFECTQCNTVIDRDMNAAINLKNYGTAKCAGSNLIEVKACGEGSSLGSNPDSSSEKQEVKINNY